MNYAAHFVSNQKVYFAHVLSDNVASLYSTTKLQASRQATRQVKIVRCLFKHVWWTSGILHLFWVPANSMPADVISRIPNTRADRLGRAMVSAQQQWDAILSNFKKSTSWGRLEYKIVSPPPPPAGWGWGWEGPDRGKYQHSHAECTDFSHSLTTIEFLHISEFFKIFEWSTTPPACSYTQFSRVD